MSNFDEEKRVDPVEVFQVLGASEEASPEALGETAKEVGASPEVVELMENLPPDVSEPSDVVAVAIDPIDAAANDAGAQLEVPDENETKPELTIDDVVTGGKARRS